MSDVIKIEISVRLNSKYAGVCDAMASRARACTNPGDIRDAMVWSLCILLRSHTGTSRRRAFLAYDAACARIFSRASVGSLLVAREGSRAQPRRQVRHSRRERLVRLQHPAVGESVIGGRAGLGRVSRKRGPAGSQTKSAGSRDPADFNQRLNACGLRFPDLRRRRHARRPHARAALELVRNGADHRYRDEPIRITSQSKCDKRDSPHRH
jgi:hypothetical protein